MADPGAKRSTMLGLLLENEETPSVLVDEPTVTAEEMQAGEPTEFSKPSLPLAITVAMPAARRRSMIGLVGSVSQKVLYWPPPRLMFTAAMA